MKTFLVDDLCCPDCLCPLDAPRSSETQPRNCPDCGQPLFLERVDGMWYVDTSPLRTPVVAGHWGGSLAAGGAA